MDAKSVRRAMVDPGDIRADVQFQNDVCRLMAMLDERNPPLEALSCLEGPAAFPRLARPAPRGATTRLPRRRELGTVPMVARPDDVTPRPALALVAGGR